MKILIFILFLIIEVNGEPSAGNKTDDNPPPGQPAGTDDNPPPGQPAGTDDNPPPGQPAGTDDNPPPGQPAGTGPPGGNKTDENPPPGQPAGTDDNPPPGQPAGTGPPGGNKTDENPPPAGGQTDVPPPPGPPGGNKTDDNPPPGPPVRGRTETPTVQTEAPILQTEVPTLQTEAPTLQTEAPTLQTEVPTVQTEAPILQTEVPTLQTEAPILQTEVPTLQTEVPTLQTEAPILQTEVPTLQTEAPTLQTEVPTVQTEAPIPPGSTEWPTTTLPIKIPFSTAAPITESTASEEPMSSTTMAESTVEMESTLSEGPMLSSTAHPEESTTVEETMETPTMEPMPKETTAENSMASTLGVLQFNSQTIKECVFTQFSVVQLANDNRDDRWIQSYNQAKQIATTQRGEDILGYKYTTPPEQKREDKFEINLQDNMELEKPPLVLTGGEKLLKAKLEEHAQSEGSEPLKKMLALDGIDYFLAREIRLIKNRYCMFALLVALRRAQDRPVRLMPIAVSLNKDIPDKFVVLHDFNETGAGHEDRYHVMLSIAIDEIKFAMQSPPADSSMVFYATYVGVDGQNVLVEIEAPRVDMREMMESTTPSSNDPT